MIAILTPPSASSSTGEALIQIDSNGRATLRVAAVLIRGASRYNLQDSAGNIYLSTTPSTRVGTSQSVRVPASLKISAAAAILTMCNLMGAMHVRPGSLKFVIYSSHCVGRAGRQTKTKMASIEFQTQ